MKKDIEYRTFRDRGDLDFEEYLKEGKKYNEFSDVKSSTKTKRDLKKTELKDNVKLKPKSLDNKKKLNLKHSVRKRKNSSNKKEKKVPLEKCQANVQIKKRYL